MVIRWDSESNWKNNQDSSGTVGRNGDLKQGYSRERPDLSSDLVGYWPLHDENATDYSGNGNHGTLNGGVTTGVAGKGGLQAMSFDGNDDYIDTSGIDFSGFSEFSVSVWVKLRSTSSTVTVWSADENSSSSIIELQYNNSADEFLWRVGDSSKNVGVYSNTSPSPKDWYHVVATTKENGNLKIYVNGVNESSVSFGTLGNPSTNHALGRKEYDNTQYLEGNISNFRVYDKALSDSEVQTLYRWGSGDFARPLNNENSSSAVSRWAFDGDVTDSWGTNDGTVNGASYVSSGGVRSGAYSFSSDSDYIDAGENERFTYSLWMSNDDTGRRDLLGFNQNNSSTHNVQINSNNNNNNETGNLRWSYKDSSGTKLQAELGRSIPINSGFNHLVFVHRLDQSELRFFFNGIEVPLNYSSQNSPSAEDFPINFYLGNQNYKGSPLNAIKGKLDDFRIYSKALSKSEIFELYRYGTRGRDLRKQLVNY